MKSSELEFEFNFLCGSQGYQKVYELADVVGTAQKNIDESEGEYTGICYREAVKDAVEWRLDAASLAESVKYFECLVADHKRRLTEAKDALKITR